MVVIFLCFIAIALLLLIDFKKGVLMYAPLKLFFNMNVRFGPFTFDLAMSLLILVLFLIKRKQLICERFPLAKYFTIYAIGYIITCLFPTLCINFIPRIVIMVLAFSVIYYYCLQNKKDLQFAILCYSLFAIIMCGNGLLEPLMGKNPLDGFLQSVSVADEEQSMFLDNELIRGGQVRYRSFIPHSISYGVACCIILYLILWKRLIFKEQESSQLITITAMCFLLSGVIICGSRTPILGLMPLILIIFDKKYVPAKMRRNFIIIALIFAIVCGDYIIYSIVSIFNPNISNDAGGSSTDMRLVQYILAFNWMLENPFLGKGMLFEPQIIDSDIYGAESVWLPLMMNNGIVGILSYAIIYVGCYKVFRKSSGSFFLLLFSGGWLLMRTATSLIGVTDAQFFTCVFIVYRYYELQNQQKAKSPSYALIHHNSNL